MHTPHKEGKDNMVPNNVRMYNCFVDILEMEDKSEELVELLASFGFLDEDGELTRSGHDLINGMEE